jgi:enamine deaminase RidA (YjgF/YER057c/UK114 family)
MIVRVGGSAPYEERYGYCRVALAGGWALTAGTTAVGPDGPLHPGDAYAQARTAFGIALDALAGVGVPRSAVVRTRMYVVDAAHTDAVGRGHGELFGDVRPVATMVIVSGLVDPPLLVEGEVEAYVGEGAGTVRGGVGGTD